MSKKQRTLLVVLLALALPELSYGEDLVEFLSGAKSRGAVLEIRKNKKEVVFESRLGDRTFERVYPYEKIHAITYKNKRYVINELKSPEPPEGQDGRRGRPEVMELIDAAGRRPPDWYDSTPLEYPETLDLNWPEPAPKPWNNQRNIGQYIWDVINPNASKWRGGIRFMHHLLARHKDDSKTTRRVMQAIGGMYFRFFQDYARAAFWWQKTGVKPGSGDSVALAECYWRLGNKQMALDMLDSSRLRVGAIKLLGDMGETRRALQLAELYVRNAREPHWALLAAGDACRLVGQYDKAIRYYQRVLDAEDLRNQQYSRRVRGRAEQSIEAIQLFELLDLRKVADGEYQSESLGYEGPVVVGVTVKSGRIEDVKVTRHKEKQFYSALTDTPSQILAKQSVKDVDATSRATITSEAIISATARALSKGMSN